ncbi:hypothetical protein [Kineococcus radiotolerans]|uniref:Uncharacterized protein n=1 Tax=Kineococcus radiotolerans (strain ATCC BAA-149 / DSM 14245 / SRS30216) TaxID=266940 RepID=A6W8T1_KINRD|nr:hypothetical protein [Kineococcus radiotolerans]ABS03220.1 hypothetical protein Krad_1734 [Kineococcus radiotolerans SRS30216 = ATCC BAA-149]
MPDDPTSDLADALGKAVLELTQQRGNRFYLAGGLWHAELNLDEKDDDLPRLARAALAWVDKNYVPRLLVERVLELDDQACSGQSYNLLNAIVRAPHEIDRWK